jgi:hypothetical protein
MILIRYILISIVVYLLIRSFVRFSDSNEPSVKPDGQDKKNKPVNKRVSKEVGEYVDYEELKK